MIILKIGGGAALNLQGIAANMQSIEEPVIVVHGANALRDELARRLNSNIQKVTSVSGYSSVLSTEEVIDLQMLAYAGLKNKRLVEIMQQHGINAVGLSGLDGAVIRARRNPGIRTRENGKLKLIRDFSGKPDSINTKLLDLLLENSFVPLLTVPILDENNHAVNSENDDIVALLNKHYKADKIIHFIEAPGLLENADDPYSLIKQMSKIELSSREEKMSGRIKRKLHAINTLLKDGARQIIIADGRTENPLKDALSGKGTVIQ
ncbi:MAG: [LysW]-aminoadipate kinase [Calditrichae bacterium]|nr:[LysW]-aminoadipate kinase [Calditrichia bacterium]